LSRYALAGSGWSPELAATGTVILGVVSVLLPEQAPSPGVAWGTAAMLRGILFVAVAEFEPRRESQNARTRFPTLGARRAGTSPAAQPKA
jgi:hypothetical protein